MYTITVWEVLKLLYFDQKQTLTSIILRGCSEKFRKIHRKTSVPMSLSNTQNSMEHTSAGVAFL